MYIDINPTREIESRGGELPEIDIFHPLLNKRKSKEGRKLESQRGRSAANWIKRTFGSY